MRKKCKYLPEVLVVIDKRVQFLAVFRSTESNGQSLGVYNHSETDCRESGTKVNKSEQKWTKVNKSEQKWTKVNKSEQKWTKVNTFKIERLVTSRNLWIHLMSPSDTWGEGEGGLKSVKNVSWIIWMAPKWVLMWCNRQRGFSWDIILGRLMVIQISLLPDFGLKTYSWLNIEI